MPDPNWTAEGIVEVAVIGHWSNSHPVINVLHYQAGVVGPHEVADEVRSKWQTSALNPIPNNYTFDMVRYRDRDSEDGATGMIPSNVAQSTQGQAASSALPPNNCALVHKVCLTTSKQRAGRMFFPGISEADVDEDGLVSSGARTGIRTAVLPLASLTIGGEEVNMAVVHLIGAGDAVGTSSQVTDLQVDTRSASSRRRLR